MSIDLYTKGVLTVIAIALAVIALRGFAPVQPAVAQTAEPVNVRICDEFFRNRCAEVSADGRLLVEPAR
ncbi:MAG: hypothetical protein AB7O56_04000 [Bauldia sp.]